MCSFDYPTAGLEAGILFPLLLFLAAGFDVRLVVTAFEKSLDVLRMVTLIQIDVLAANGRGLWPGDRDAVESRLEKFDVVCIGTADLDSQRDTATVSEDRTLGTQLTAISRIFACIFPHPEATWSSLRPRFANSTGCL